MSHCLQFVKNHRKCAHKLLAGKVQSCITLEYWDGKRFEPKLVRMLTDALQRKCTDRSPGLARRQMSPMPRELLTLMRCEL